MDLPPVSSLPPSPLLEAFPEAVIICDDQDRILAWNRCAESLYGYRASEAAGQVLVDLLRLGDPATDEASTTIHTRDGDWTASTKAGQRLVVACRQQQSAAPDGALLRVELHRDVTRERRSARWQWQLQTVMAQLTTVTTLPDMITIILSSGRQASGAFAGLVYLPSPDGQTLDLAGAEGYDPARINPYRRVHVSDEVPVAVAARTGAALYLSAETYSSMYPRAPFRDPVTRSLTALPLHFGGELRGVLGFSFRTDEQFDLEEQGFLLALANQCALALERARSYEAIRLELVERQRAEQQAEQERATLAAVLDQLPALVYTKQPDGTVTFVNKAMETTFGFARERWLGHTEDALFGAEFFSRMRANDLAVLASQTAAVFEEVGPRPDPATYHTTKFALRNLAGEPTLLVGVSVDITERKRAEIQLLDLNETLEAHVRARTTDLERLNTELDAFGYSVSHDLRAPVRQLLGLGRLLRRHLDQADARTGELLDMMTTSADRMNIMIDALLELARVGQGPLRRDTVNLGALVRQVQLDLTSEYQTGGVTWQVDTFPEVQGDLALLRQVFVNLIGNALKYTGTQVNPRIEIGHTVAD